MCNECLTDINSRIDVLEKQACGCSSSSSTLGLEQHIQQLETEILQGGYYEVRQSLFARLNALRTVLALRNGSDVPTRRPMLRPPPLLRTFCSDLTPCNLSQIEQSGVECCTICLGEFSEDKQENGYCSFTKTKCGHFFHTLCLRTWIRTFKTTCPTCRSDMFCFSSSSLL